MSWLAFCFVLCLVAPFGHVFSLVSNDEDIVVFEKHVENSEKPQHEEKVAGYDGQCIEQKSVKNGNQCLALLKAIHDLLMEDIDVSLKEKVSPTPPKKKRETASSLDKGNDQAKGWATSGDTEDSPTVDEGPVFGGFEEDGNGTSAPKVLLFRPPPYVGKGHESSSPNNTQGLKNAGSQASVIVQGVENSNETRNRTSSLVKAKEVRNHISNTSTEGTVTSENNVNISSPILQSSATRWSLVDHVTSDHAETTASAVGPEFLGSTNSTEGTVGQDPEAATDTTALLNSSTESSIPDSQPHNLQSIAPLRFLPWPGSSNNDTFETQWRSLVFQRVPYFVPAVHSAWWEVEKGRRQTCLLLTSIDTLRQKCCFTLSLICPEYTAAAETVNKGQVGRAVDENDEITVFERFGGKDIEGKRGRRDQPDAGTIYVANTLRRVTGLLSVLMRENEEAKL